jgi:3-phenylpropionate/trans-cinnamate dioxygenase ferredoxin subunit
MAEFVEVMRLEELPPGKGTMVTVAGKDVALFNVDGTIYAMEDSCLHQGLSLGTSQLEGKVVTCRGHGWRPAARRRKRRLYAAAVKAAASFG